MRRARAVVMSPARKRPRDDNDHARQRNPPQEYERTSRRRAEPDGCANEPCATGWGDSALSQSCFK